jgi:seryl-tRNA synthetase
MANMQEQFDKLRQEFDKTKRDLNERLARTEEDNKRLESRVRELSAQNETKDRQIWKLQTDLTEARRNLSNVYARRRSLPVSCRTQCFHVANYQSY